MKVFSSQWSVVGKSFFCVKVCALLLPLCTPVEAQQTEELRRIGFLGAAFPSSNPTRREALRQGLHALGWVEGRNLVIEWRFAEGSRDRLSKLGLELARLPVEVIVTGGPAPTRALKEANITIPVVMGFDNDPVGSRFVASLARPGGNITAFRHSRRRSAANNWSCSKRSCQNSPAWLSWAILPSLAMPKHLKNWGAWQSCSGCSFNILRYKRTKILRPPLKRRPRSLPTPFSFWAIR